MVNVKTSVILLLFLDTTYCFFAENKPYGSGTDTKAHTEITYIGCSIAIQKYVIAKKNSTSISDFFKQDWNGQQQMMRHIDSLARHVADTQMDMKDKAYVHCHADQILLAHKFIKHCKGSLRSRVADLDELKAKLGQCLYTLQSFYSNTNWVEMFGNKVYKDFGNDKIIMDVVSMDEDTCLDMADFDRGCHNNLLVHDKLTSGYYYGRGNTKPPRPLGSSKGKCSHGGPSDSSRKLVAKCGINKDSQSEMYSPHHHLHATAYEAAIHATAHFLSSNENGTGILDILGEDIFDTLFHVKARVNVSLAFAIDYTGSMTDEISAVKEYVIQLLTSTISSRYEPADYVLSLFHDPVSYNKIFKFTDGNDMIKKVQEIQTVDGENKDCPEFAVAGMLNAIEKVLPRSPVFVFTDADAKDSYRFNELISAVKAKAIRLELFISNECARRRRNAVKDKGKRMERSFSFFQRLAIATGGTMHHTDKQHIGIVLNEVLTKMFPSEEVIIDSFLWDTVGDDVKRFVVDSTVSVLKISIKGTASVTDVNIFDVNGNLEMFMSKTATRIRTGKGEIIVSLQKPSPGIMEIRRHINIELSVNITAQSRLSISLDLFQDIGHGNLVRLKGSPIADKEYSMCISVYNIGNNGTLDKVSMVTQTGAILSVYQCVMTRSEPSVKCCISVLMSYGSFQLKINGTDKNEYDFERKLSTELEPKKVELVVKATFGDAVLNKELPISYILHHYGTDTDNYIVTITSSHPSVLIGPSFREHTVLASESANGTFTLKPSTPSIFISYTVAVVLTATHEIQQSTTRKLLITDVERPMCSITNVSGSCDESSLNTANCSLYKWIAIATVTFSGVELESITADSKVELYHKNLTNLFSGPVKVNIKGDCCNPSVYLTVVDVDDWITQCSVFYSNGTVVKSVEIVSVPGIVNRHDSSIIIIAVASSASFIVALAFIGFMFKYLMKRPPPSTKIKKIDTIQRPQFDIKQIQAKMMK